MQGSVVYCGGDEITQVSVSLTVDSTLQTVHLPRILELPVDDRVMLLPLQSEIMIKPHVYQREES